VGKRERGGGEGHRRNPPLARMWFLREKEEGHGGGEGRKLDHFEERGDQVFLDCLLFVQKGEGGKRRGDQPGCAVIRSFMSEVTGGKERRSHEAYCQRGGRKPRSTSNPFFLFSWKEGKERKGGTDT